MDVPFELEPTKMRRLRFCISRTISTAVSVSGAAPRMAAKPGMRPSTSWMPSERSCVSVKKPSQSGWGSSPKR